MVQAAQHCGQEVIIVLDAVSGPCDLAMAAYDINMENKLAGVQITLAVGLAWPSATPPSQKRA